MLAAAGLQPAVAQDDTSVPPCGLYFYKAEIVRVIDGDSVEADIDLGFNTWRRGENLRLARINAPEVKGDSREEGLKSAAELRALIEGQSLFICTIKDEQGKFGRYLVEVFTGANHRNVNDWMLNKGFAVPYE